MAYGFPQGISAADEAVFGERRGFKYSEWNVLRKIALEYVKRVDPGKGISLSSAAGLLRWTMITS